jgi:hypothetical protein
LGALIYFVRVKGPRLILTPPGDDAGPTTVDAETTVEAADGDEPENGTDASDHTANDDTATDPGPPGARAKPGAGPPGAGGEAADGDAVQSSPRRGDESDGGDRSGDGDAAPSASATKP